MIMRKLNKNYSNFCLLATWVVLLIVSPEMAQSAVIFETILAVNLDMSEKSAIFEANGLFDVENKVEKFLDEVLIERNILKVGVAVQDQSLVPGNVLRVESQLSLVYMSDSPMNFSNFFESNVDNTALAAALQIENVFLLFEEVIGTAELAVVPNEGETKLGDTGLLLSTVGLFVTVVIIATILLYVTGCCGTFRDCLLNLCFEEIDEPEDQIVQKSTFPVDQGYDDESPSIAESSVAETAATGILGAVSNSEHQNPALNLGIKTPTRYLNQQDTESNITGMSDIDDSEMDTPQSELTNQSINTAALGITSMRKLLHITDDETTESRDVGKQNESLDQGLSYMILDRLTDKK